ncbi:MAG: OmpA family protein [Spirochaetaceae bacterium]|jgi:outer membrane protein OmpA-like peptidoglycan-associated protein|nr:OmpA family protein [Spirochaetaceae bacterium]
MQKINHKRQGGRGRFKTYPYGKGGKFSALTTVFCLLFVVVLSIDAETFTWKFPAGSQYRILSTVDEEVYINRQYSHTSNILNRIAASVKADNIIEGIYQTSESAGKGKVFTWAEEYSTSYRQDARGMMTVEKSAFMPMVRNLPVFPAKDLEPGDSWEAEGLEVHDFRKNFNIKEPYPIPFTANYTYKGNNQFEISYRIYETKPLKIIGESKMSLLWDAVNGRPASYTEDFRMIFEMNDGAVIEYKGSAKAEIHNAENMNKEQLAKDLSEEIPEGDVRVTDEGIAISLDNINFPPDSPELIASEAAKLNAIIAILKKYPDRDILVAGHTAKIGDAASSMRLSEARAASVANYLIQSGVRSPEHIIAKGYGDTRPLADNAGEEGRKKNRRVEIILLEN